MCHRALQISASVTHTFLAVRHATHNVRVQNGGMYTFVGLPDSASSRLPAIHRRVLLKENTFKTAILVRHRPCDQ
jgi:hypothetical protein